MQTHLRFGMQRDKPLIHQEKGKIDGIVVPAHILAHQTPSTSVFISSLPEKPYLIDPMTFVFQNPTEAHVNEAGALRQSIGKLCRAYHPNLAECLQGLDAEEALEPDELPDTEELCEGVLKFQREAVAAGSALSGARKYLDRYAVSRATEPRAVVPPYFYFEMIGDGWYELALECARITARLAPEGVKVLPVVHCEVDSLTGSGIARISKDYSPYGQVMMWINNFVQGAVDQGSIAQVRSLVRAFDENEVSIESLYGGYLMMLMSFDGLAAVSHGILYTESKSTTLTPGSGGPAERYYIPKFHEFRSLGQTDLIIHRHPELICDCAVCKRHMGGKPDNIVRYMDNPELLQEHFLTVRRAEADALGASSPQKEADALRRTYAAYHASISDLPNPDAFISKAPMKGLAYLERWASAIV